MKRLLELLMVGMAGALVIPAGAAVITFDDAISGEIAYSFDGDGDGVDDVIFSTTDPDGFNTVGPGPNQSYIDEPGLEGTTRISPDLRVDFLVGAVGTLQFGFALNTPREFIDGVTFDVFDGSDTLLASANLLAAFTTPDGINPSSFPEGLLSVSFAGTAAYATFDFSSFTASRYIIDNFEGTFGSTEIPEPPLLALLAMGGAVGAWRVLGRRHARTRLRGQRAYRLSLVHHLATADRPHKLP